MLATCIAAALLAACTPPGATTPAPDGEAQAENPAATSASPNDSGRSAAATRRAQRRDASAATPSSGQYKYIDERGKLRVAVRLEDIPERQRSTASPLEAPASTLRTAPSDDESGAIQMADVTIYTTRSCGYCRAAMAHFDTLGLDYTNHDVENDEAARAEYLELTGGRRGVPVIVVGDAWIQGWSKPEFERLLAASR
jgi:glutaredoxin